MRNAATLCATAWCLEVHDLLLSKAVAGRDKDARFLRDAARHGLANQHVLLDRHETMPITLEMRGVVKERILHAFSA